MLFLEQYEEKEEKKKISRISYWKIAPPWVLASKPSVSTTLNLIPANLGYANEVLRDCGKGKKVPINIPEISSSAEVQLSLLASSGLYQKKLTREEYQTMSVKVLKVHN